MAFCILSFCCLNFFGTDLGRNNPEDIRRQRNALVLALTLTSCGESHRINVAHEAACGE